MLCILSERGLPAALLACASAVTDRPSVSSLIHASLKSYEIYAGPDHVREASLKTVDIEIYFTLS